MGGYDNLTLWVTVQTGITTKRKMEPNMEDILRIGTLFLLSGVTMMGVFRCLGKISGTIHIRTGLLLLMPLFFTACMKEDRHNCPPEYGIHLGVKDKNYSNAADVPDLAIQSEQLAFRQYVQTLSYTLKNLGTGTSGINVPLLTVSGDEKTEAISFPDITAGLYQYTAFGNISEKPALQNGVTTYTLHPNGTEDLDTYLLSDTLSFTGSSADKYIELLRTKGALLVVIENLPDSVVRIQKQVQSVYRDIDQNFNYSTETNVAKDFTTQIHPTATLLTVLAPTVAGKQSVLRIALYTAGSTMPFMFIPDIQMTITRNKLTAFKLIFTQEGVEVWVMLNDSWTKAYDLDITLN